MDRLSWRKARRQYEHIREINTLNAELNPIRHLLALVGTRHIVHVSRIRVNTLNAELNPIRHLLTLVGTRHIVHDSRIRVKCLSLTFRFKCTNFKGERNANFKTNFQ